MRPKLLIALLFPLCVLSWLIPTNLQAQTETHNFITYDTTVTVIGGMWNLRITRPANMFTAGHPDTASRPAIIFMVGSGEITNPAYLALYGPHHWLNSGWDGGIQLGNGRHYPIIISVQPYTTGPTSRSTGNLLLHILNTYHVKSNGVHLTGLSMGAIRWEMLLSAERTVGGEDYMKRITSIAALSGTYDLNGQPDWVRGDLPERDLLISPSWKGAKTWVKKYNGKYFALEGVSDGTQAYLWMGTQPMNDTMPGSAYFSYYPSGHCCWNTMYDPGMTNWNCVGPNPLGSFITTGYAPNTIGTYKTGDYIFKWMLKQGDTTLVGSTPANQAPSANAGANQTIILPTSSVTLSGGGTDPDGTISSYSWSQVSGTSATIASPATAATNITGLATAGARVFRLTVTDNNGSSATSDVTVTVNTAGGGGIQNETNDFITEDSTVNFPGVGAWNYRISRPRHMFTPGHADTASRPAIIFMVGVGEACNCFGYLALNGPHAIYNPSGGGWDGGLQLGNGKHYPIYISVQPHAQWPSTRSSRMLIEFLVNRYHIKRNSVHLTGLSMGAMTWTRMINSQTSPGDETSMKLVKSIAALQGQGNAYYAWRRDANNSAPLYQLGGDSVVTPELFQDMYTEPLGSAPNPQSLAWKAYKIWAKKYGGRYFSLNGITDFAGVDNWLISEAMNDTLPNTGYFAWENIGGGQHCCWNNMYDPNHTDWTSVGALGPGIVASGYNSHPNTMGNYHTGDNIFTWMIKQGDTTLVGSAPGNQVPTANAGANQTITLPASSATLSGSGTDPDGTIASYSWTQVSGTAATIASPSTAATNITGLTTAGVRVFRLTVADNLGATATSDVSVTVIAGAGAIAVSVTNTNPLTTAGNSASLTSTSSSAAGIANTKWTKFSVPGQTAKTLTVVGSSTAACNGVSGPTGFDSCFITRFKAYYQALGLLGTVTNIAQAGTSPFDFNITTVLNYNSDIVLVSFPSNGYTAANNANALARLQEYKDSCDARGKQFYITGTQPRNDFSPADRANLVVMNDLLRTTFGVRFIDFLTPLLNTVDNTMKPEYNADNIHPNNAGHRIIFDKLRAANIFQTYTSSASAITTPATGNTTVTGLAGGTHKFQVSVIDNAGYAASDVAVVNVSVSNQSPTANAGANQTITLPASSVTLSGSGTDPDGTIASYAWTQISGTAATIASSSTAATNITGLSTVGVRVFRLTVMDNQGATGTSDVTITVNAAAPPNQSPTANAGANQTITLPASAVTLSGSGTDPDGTIASYAWTQVSGTAATIASPSTSSTNITGLGSVGVRVFRLTVTDNQGATGTSDVTITVNNAAPPNQPPTANAGSNQAITLPTSNTTLSGSGTDPDGTIASYAWTQVSGTAATIASPSTAATNITGLTTAGARVFRLTVTDNQGATGTSDVTITVNASANQPPTANAGANQTITLPVSGVTLSGSGTDPDGTIASYAWTQVSGTAAAIGSPSTSSTNITGLGSVGVRVFRLTVTDNQGATGTSDVTITVNNAAPPNQPPTANAGSNQAITLPTSNTTLSGSGTDPDGTIASYAWTQVSGTAATIASPSTAATNITGLTTAGARVFRLTVTDNQGATGTADVTVTVNAAANQPPTANAGSNQTITLPVSGVTLSGSGTDPDGTIASYAWTQVSGTAATIASPSTAATNITGLATVGVRVFRLTVTDNQGATGTSDVTITVNAAVNQPPTANAGSNQTITLPTSNTTLSGSGTDPDGTIASYAWTQVSGTTATIESPSNAATNITGLITAGTRVFRLTVTDNLGATGTSDVTITVNSAANQSPNANAGPNQTITLPTSSATLSGSGTDPDGTIISYVWTQVSGTAATIASPSTAATNITGLTTAGVRVFRLTVTDNLGATAASDVTVTVNATPNQAPTANAGTNQTITLPTSGVTLSGSGTDPDGTITSYAWTQVSGTAATIASPSTASTNITGLTTVGIRVFRLTVTDNQGATATSDVTITVNAAANQPPTANAGSNQTITLPASSVTLSGSGTDPDGTIASYAWTQVNGTAATIASPSTASTNITGLTTVGIRVFRLTVTDNQGATATSDVTITVNAAANQPPTANAGANLVITLPTSSVTLSGSGTDPDGTIASYVWTQVSGTAATIASPSTAATNITGLTTVGIRVFRLTVTDNQGATATSDVIVTVNAASPPPNQPPVANAGLNINITLPTNTANLTGSGTDADGIIASYQWAKISGPAQFAIAVPSQAQTTVINLVEGVYQFELTVTDNQGATGRSTVTITVNPVVRQPPTANAGSDQTITLPTYLVTVSGSGTSDPDRPIVSYQWTKVAGPAQFTIVSPTQAQTVIKNLVKGAYLFELKVTDSHGGIGRDTVKIEVREESASTARMYPNPATTSINIEINAVTSSNHTNISIFDARGVIVYQEQFMRSLPVIVKQVDIERFPRGSYFISIDVDINNKQTLQFVKQ